MHYFTDNANIAAVESPEQAAKYRDAGWQPITREEYMRAWRRRDMVAVQRILIETYHRRQRQRSIPVSPWHGV